MTRASEKKKEWMAVLGALEIGDVDLANKICKENQFDLDEPCALVEKDKMKRRGNNVKIEGIKGQSEKWLDFMTETYGDMPEIVAWKGMESEVE